MRITWRHTVEVTPDGALVDRAAAVGPLPGPGQGGHDLQALGAAAPEYLPLMRIRPSAGEWGVLALGVLTRRGRDRLRHVAHLAARRVSLPGSLPRAVTTVLLWTLLPASRLAVLLLVGGLVAGVLADDLRPALQAAVTLAVAMWWTTGLHEVAHVVAARAGGRAGPAGQLGLGVLTAFVTLPGVCGRRAVLVAAAGPVVGALAALSTLLVLPPGYRWIACVICLGHLANLSAAAPDGRLLRSALRP